MKLRILSDLHLEHDLPPAVPHCDADVVILAGDIANGRAGIDWAAQAFDVPVIYVPGNHEYYEANMAPAAALMAAAGAASSNVHVLDNAELRLPSPDGQPVRILGTTWWTDYDLFGTARREASMQACAAAMLDHRLIELNDGNGDGAARRFAPDDALVLHQAASAWLAAKLAEPFAGKTVVVTHHAPDLGSLDPRFSHDLVSGGFVSRRPDLVAKADLWVHGHTHTAFDYWVEDTRVVCNPRGYARKRVGGEPENPRFDWCFTVTL